MSSETKICIVCGREFEWSYGEQRHYREMGYQPPKRCPTCRAHKRYANQPGMGGESGPPDEPLMPRPVTYDNPFLPKSPTRHVPSRPQWSWWNKPLYRYGTLTLGLSLILAVTIRYVGSPLDELASWLIAVNLVTLAAYGYDKAIAKSSWMRVPEKVLLVLAFLGGTPAALIGMWRFHHKISKESFLTKFCTVS
jgi:uncharacterized membrane protein YsdA (DUF1294 family)